jgi:uncharacterized protein YqkB
MPNQSPRLRSRFGTDQIERLQLLFDFAGCACAGLGPSHKFLNSSLKSPPSDPSLDNAVEEVYIFMLPIEEPKSLPAEAVLDAPGLTTVD